MNDQVWYVFQTGKQMGPFGDDQIKQMSTNQLIAQDAYLFKVGWKDWRPIEDCSKELSFEIVVTGVTPPAPSGERRSTAPRATVSGRVIVHNNGQLVIGSGVNISSSGIFVETKDQIFTVGEKLKISVRMADLNKPFNVVAQVVRYNSDPNNPVGYGLQFEDLDKDIARDIQRSVDNINSNSGESQAAQ